MFNKTVPKEKYFVFITCRPDAAIAMYYSVLLLSVLPTELHIFCRIIARNAQNKPKMVTSCLSICFIPDSSDRLSVKFSIWSVDLINYLRKFVPGSNYIFNFRTKCTCTIEYLYWLLNISYMFRCSLLYPQGEIFSLLKTICLLY
jgi:hypothetical protein